jgi:hypothetical protein
MKQVLQYGRYGQFAMRNVPTDRYIEQENVLILLWKLVMEHINKTTRVMLAHVQVCCVIMIRSVKPSSV